MRGRIEVPPRKARRVDPYEAGIRANAAYYNVVVIAPRPAGEPIRQMSYNINGIHRIAEAHAIARDFSTMSGVRSTMIYAVAASGRFVDVGTYRNGKWTESV